MSCDHRDRETCGLCCRQLANGYRNEFTVSEMGDSNSICLSNLNGDNGSTFRCGDFQSVQYQSGLRFIALSVSIVGKLSSNEVAQRFGLGVDSNATGHRGRKRSLNIKRRDKRFIVQVPARLPFYVANTAQRFQPRAGSALALLAASASSASLAAAASAASLAAFDGRPARAATGADFAASATVP